MAEKRWPSFQSCFLILLAGGSARVVAMTLNRLIDRHIDKENPRTRTRHLATGEMKVWEAWIFLMLMLLVYLWSAWLLSDFCLRWAWLPLVGFLIYPYLKRFTKWAHVGLGTVWALVPLGGFFAIKPSLNGIVPALILGIFSLFWLSGFDIIYATLDEEFDRQAGLYSLPATWGAKRALRLSGLFHLLAFFMLVVLYSGWFSGPLTVMLLIVIGMLLFLEHKFSGYVDLAFFHMNSAIAFGVLFFVFSGLKGV